MVCVQSRNAAYGMIAGDADTGDAVSYKPSDKSHADMNSIVTRSPSNSNEGSRLPPSKAALLKGHDRNSQRAKVYSQNITGTTKMVNDAPLQHMPQAGHRDSQSYALSNTRMEVANNQRFEMGQPHKANGDFPLDVEDLDIPWGDMVLKERIGAGNHLSLILRWVFCLLKTLIRQVTAFSGSFGVVHRADWNGSVSNIPFSV